jgi:hypothetical protein
MNHKQDHLKLISILHYMMSIITALLTAVPVVQIIAGVVMIIAPASFECKVTGHTPLIGWIFVIGGTLGVLIGIALSFSLIMSGWALGKRKKLSFCRGVSAVVCLIFPIGTAVGAFSLVVLGRPHVTSRFKTATAPDGTTHSG